MAVETVYENQDTISPRLNKQHTIVVNLGTVTVWYDRLKERLSEHADNIKTLGQFIRHPPPPPPPKKKNTHTKRHPFKLNLSITVSEKLLPHFALSVRETFFCLQSRNPSKICPVVRAWRTCFLFVCEELDPYMIFCLAHFQNLPQLSKVTEFNTDLNTRDRQTSSNVCLLKLKEKQQHIKNAIRSQSMASLSQIPVLNFSVCKKGKQKNDTCTLDCNNPKVALHAKGLYLYKSSENVYNKL